MITHDYELQTETSVSHPPSPKGYLEKQEGLLIMVQECNEVMSMKGLQLYSIWQHASEGKYQTKVPSGIQGLPRRI